MAALYQESNVPCANAATRPNQLRPVVGARTTASMFANARARSDLHRNSNVTTLSKAMAKLGIELPRDGVDGPEFLLNTPLQHALSEYARWSGISLQAFVGMVLNELCKNYTHLE
ncbi:hypothetical protein GQ600_11288 [Phytophthora cactorum]|nr:hypothetical protein GQ600_11288 [Phytophthora cactorum]